MKFLREGVSDERFDIRGERSLLWRFQRANGHHVAEPEQGNIRVPARKLQQLSAYLCGGCCLRSRVVPSGFAALDSIPHPPVG